MGAQDYGMRSMLDNRNAVALPIFQAPGANALELSDDVRKTMEELKKDFPHGLDYHIVYDPTVFVRQSIEAVMHTLLEAIVLVVLVVILFLQTWRASIIPLVAVPVSIIGTFAVLLAFGFSINTLSLFGLVLAIGIVVDDAIVVVENVERHIGPGQSPTKPPGRDERGQPPDHRDHAGAVRGVRAGRVRQRPHRRVLSPVRAHDRHLDGDLRLQLADAVAGAGGSAAEAPRRKAGPSLTDHRPLFGRFFRRFNRVFIAASNVYSGR